MIRILLCGCNGHMGRVITSMAPGMGVEIAAGIDVRTDVPNDYPVFTEPSGFTGQADVAVDFSHVSVLPKLLEYCVARKLPLVLATTGQDEKLLAMVNDAARIIPIFRSANLSLGVSLIADLVARAERVLGKGYDVEIVEAHHSRKLDAPSGTALMLADAVASEMDEKPEYTFDRHSRSEQRPKNEIGFSSIRGGNIVGEHDVMFIGANETITISHSAQNREVFATGALRAASFIAPIKKPGVYSMKDLVASM